MYFYKSNDKMVEMQHLYLGFFSVTFLSSLFSILIIKKSSLTIVSIGQHILLSGVLFLITFSNGLEPFLTVKYYFLGINIILLLLCYLTSNITYTTHNQLKSPIGILIAISSIILLITESITLSHYSIQNYHLIIINALYAIILVKHNKTLINNGFQTKYLKYTSHGLSIILFIQLISINLHATTILFGAIPIYLMLLNMSLLMFQKTNIMHQLKYVGQYIALWAPLICFFYVFIFCAETIFQNKSS